MPQTSSQHFPSPRFLALLGAMALVCLGSADAVVPVEFPGPVILNTPGKTTAGCELPGSGGGASRMLIGTDNGYVVIAAYQTFSDGFVLEGSILESGRVTALTTLPDPSGQVRELVAAFADPDRLVFMDLHDTAPYLSVRARFDLEEDPGAAVALRSTAGTMDRVVVALPGIDRLETFIREDATWRQEPALDSGDRPSGLAAPDLNGDGVSELVVINQGPLSESLHVFRQVAGVPVLQQELVLSTAPTALTVLDRDRDGRDELMVLAADAPLAWSFSESDGALGLTGSITLRAPADGLDTARLPDGRMGLYVSSRNRGLVEFQSHDGADWAQEEVYYPSCRPTVLLAAEFNGDARIDVVSIGGDLAAATVMYGTNENGLYGHPVLSLSGRPGAATVGDMNGDGDPDVVVSIGDANGLNTFYGYGEGILPAPHGQTVTFVPGAVAAIAADADAALELAVASQFEGLIYIMGHDAGGDYQVLHSVNIATVAQSLSVADIDGDGHQDLLVVAPFKPEIRICYGAGDGTFPETVAETFLWQARELVTVDLDGDGRRELVATDGFGRVSFRSNLDGRSFGGEVRINADGGALHLGLADLDGDLDEDVIVGNVAATSLTLLENDGAGSLVRRIGSYALSGQPDGVLGEDVNQDGIMDLVVNRRNDGKLGIHFGLGDWTYAVVREFVGSDDVSIFTSGDFNNDTLPDILTLDETLELGLTMLNVERVVVANEPTALSVDCDGDALEIEVRPGGRAAWALEARSGGRWRMLASAAGAVAGALSSEGEAWRLRLEPADRLAAGLGGGFDLRLAGPGGADGLEQVRAVACGKDLGADRVLTWAQEPWPNPFNPQVQARFSMSRPGFVRADVYDLQGRLVARLLAAERPAGEHVLRWNGRRDGRAAAAGVYLLRISGEQAVLTRKLMLVK